MDTVPGQTDRNNSQSSPGFFVRSSLNMSDSEKGTPIHQVENAMTGHQPKVARPVDVVHNDEALRVLENYTGEETWAADEEKKLRRKIDWRLMPVLCATYGLQYYDKAMLSQAVCFRA